jgi:hypothetical protein
LLEESVREKVEETQETVTKFLVLPAFMLFGTILPWSEWEALGLSGVAFVAWVLFLRRPPIVALALAPTDTDARSEGRKLAGILIETRPQEGWVVLGIGLNVAATELPEELAQMATSLALAAGGGGAGPAASGSAADDALSPGAVLERLLAALERWLAAPAPEVLAAWRSRDALLGRTVRWADGTGTASGINDEGELLVEAAEGRVALGAGEVHLMAGPGGS